MMNQKQTKNNILIKELKGKDEEIQLLQKMFQEIQPNQSNQNHIVIENNNGNKKIATNNQLLSIIKLQQSQINALNTQIKERDEKIQLLEKPE